MSSDQQIFTVVYATGVISEREGCSPNLSSCDPGSEIWPRNSGNGSGSNKIRSQYRAKPEKEVDMPERKQV